MKMKKGFLILFCASLIVLFTSCDKKDKDDTATASNPLVEDDIQVQGMLYEKEESNPVTFKEENSFFTFSEAEKRAYQEFSKTNDLNELKDLDAKSIAKLYVQYSVDGAWRPVYEMTDKKILEEENITEEDFFNEFIAPIKEEEAAIKTGNLNKSLKDSYKEMYSNLEEGRITVNEDVASLEFETESLDYIVGSFVKNENGIWLPIYHPFFDNSVA